jgi:hypothetical protein
MRNLIIQKIERFFSKLIGQFLLKGDWEFVSDWLNMRLILLISIFFLFCFCFFQLFLQNTHPSRIPFGTCGVFFFFFFFFMDDHVSFCNDDEEERGREIIEIPSSPEPEGVGDTTTGPSTFNPPILANDGGAGPSTLNPPIDFSPPLSVDDMIDFEAFQLKQKIVQKMSFLAGPENGPRLWETIGAEDSITNRLGEEYKHSFLRQIDKDLLRKGTESFYYNELTQKRINRIQPH